MAALALAAAALAGAAAYLLYRVDAERARATQLAATAADREAAARPGGAPSGAAPRAAAIPENAASTAALPEAAVPADRPPGMPTDEDHQARQRRSAAEFLRRYADPAARAEMRESELDAARRSMAGLEPELNLTAEQFERLVVLIADRDESKRIAAARCVVNPACLSPVFDTDLFGSVDQDIRDIIGDENMGALKGFRAAAAQRHAVSGLQSSLAGGQALSNAQADDLAHGLYDESLRQRREMYQRQQRQRGFSAANGAELMYAYNAPTPEIALQTAETYVQAMRDRAATQLQGEQLSAFNRMYDELLIEFRRFLRHQTEQPPQDQDHTP